MVRNFIFSEDSICDVDYWCASIGMNGDEHYVLYLNFLEPTRAHSTEYLTQQQIIYGMSISGR